MARYEFKLPDIGEGIAEAEIVAWHVKVGDEIAEDQQIADMMTDKATVEMESPVAGKVIELAGEVGDQVPIGSVLAVIETEAAAPAEEAPATVPTAPKNLRALSKKSFRLRPWRRSRRSRRLHLGSNRKSPKKSRHAPTSWLPPPCAPVPATLASISRR